MQLRIHLVICAIIASLATAQALAQQATTNTPGEEMAKVAEQAAAAAPQPEEPKMPEPGDVMAKVNGTEITFKQIEDELQRVPEYQRANYRRRVLASLVSQILEDKFAEARSLEANPEELKKRLDELEQRYQEILKSLERDVNNAKGNIARSLKLQSYIDAATTDEKAKKLMSDMPHLFDKSKITVSHILVKTEPIDSSSVQKAARDKLTKLREKILAGEITFEDAAKADSDCPSKEDGGDLGEVSADGKMDMVFTLKSFQCPEGEISAPFMTSFGWHIVKVTATEFGDGQPVSSQVRGQETSAEELAKMILTENARNDVRLFGVDECKVENLDLLPKPAPRPTPRPRMPMPMPGN